MTIPPRRLTRNQEEALSHWKEGTKYVIEGGRSPILINGGASIGILTFIGNNHPPSGDVISALTLFAWGALAGVVLFVFAYVAQLQYGNRAIGDKHANIAASVAHWLGYIATAFSIGLFVWGMHAAAQGFSEQFLGRKRRSSPRHQVREPRAARLREVPSALA